MKASYHPAILIGFYLNCLPDKLYNHIPRSTRFDWKHKNNTVQFGHQWFLQNQALFSALQAVSTNQRLLQINLALLRVIALQRFMKKYAEQLREHVFNTPQVILHTIRKLKKIIGLSGTLRMLQFSYSQYLRLHKAKKCIRSVLNNCIVKHPSQLLKKEIGVIQAYCTDEHYVYWPLSAVYHQIRRDGAAFFSLGVFYKYSALLQLKRFAPCHRRKNHTIGIRAAAPLQILHADVTVFKTEDGQRSFIYLVQDNFSRNILRYAIADSCKASIVFDNLRQVAADFLTPAGIADCTIITDDGSENKGVRQYITGQHGSTPIQHLIAQKDILFSNSMIEAANKQLKYRFLYQRAVPDRKALEVYVQQAVEDFNNRPHHVLSGLTPAEVLKGQVPARHSYAAQMEKAKTERMEQNRKTACCFYSF